jgi:hypothetical protein
MMNKFKVSAQSLKPCVLSFSFALYILHLTLGITFAQTVSSTELINHAKDYDNKTVVYAGEVIGDIMVRNEFAWVNVNDGNNAIGIWLKKDLTKDIVYAGSYQTQGDGVEIVGIFHRACQEHGGDLDIHAQSLKKIHSGSKTFERLSAGKRNLILVLPGVLFIVWIFAQLKPR